MPNRRQQEGSFREPIEQLLPRLTTVTERQAPRAKKDRPKESKANCPAFHNQALFERSQKREC